MSENDRRKRELISEAVGKAFDLSPNDLPIEFYDFFKVVKMGAEKYGMSNWLKPGGTKSSEKDMAASMFRHLAQSTVTLYGDPVDEESGLDPLLHLACRALMLYTRRQRNITHPNDIGTITGIDSKIDDKNCIELYDFHARMQANPNQYYKRDEE